MTSGDLINAVAAFTQRRPENYIRHGFDCLLRACNNARLYTERVIDFEMARVSATIPAVDINNGGSLDTAVLYGTVTPVNIKKIKRPFISFANSSNAVPVGFYSRDVWLSRMKRLWEKVTPLQVPSVTTTNLAQYWTKNILSTLQPYNVIQMARTIFVVPADIQALGGSTFPIHLDCFKRLPDYGSTVISGVTTNEVENKLVDTPPPNFISSGVRIGMVVNNTDDGTSAIVTAVEGAGQLGLNANIFGAAQNYTINVANETDFLLDNCFDWLMYRSIQELNFFLKEDERVALSAEIVRDSWEAVKSWNQNLISQGVDDADLA